MPETQSVPEEGRMIMSPISQEAALKQAEILAMRQISESLNQVSRRLDKADTKLEEVHTTLTRMEAQNVRGQLAEFKAEVKEDRLRRDAEFLAYKKSRDDLEGSYDSRVKSLELIVARYSGVFIPISMLAAAMTSAIGSVIISKVMGGH